MVSWAKLSPSSAGHVSLSARSDFPTFAERLAEMLFGIATALGLCRDGELGQCAAHYIMGSAFIGYAAILVIMLNLGGKWLDRKGVSQEMLDSWVIMLWVRHL